jgi:phage FluMu protein Com
MVFHLKKPCPNCGEADYAKSWKERSTADRITDTVSRALPIRCWKCNSLIGYDTKRSVWIGVAGLTFFVFLGAFGGIPKDAAYWAGGIFALASAFAFTRLVVIEETDK